MKYLPFSGRKYCSSLLVYPAIAHCLTNQGFATRKDSEGIPNKTGQCTAFCFWSFSTMCYVKQAYGIVLSEQETRQCK